MKREQLNPSQQQKSARDTMTFMVHKDVKKHLEAGKRLFDLGDVAKALNHYKAALAIDPDCALVHFNLGFAFSESQDREAAKRCYQRAIELEPECSLFLEHLAKIYFESEEYSQAISLFQRAHGVGKIQPVSFGLWGRCYYELGEYESSAEQMGKMLRHELSPTLTGYARYYLVLSWLRAGRLFRARAEMEPLLTLEMSDYEMLADLGEQLLDAKCITLSKRCFERFLDKREDLAVRKSYQEIVDIEQRVDQILPRLFSGDEERILQNIHLLYQFGSEKVGRALASIQDAHSPLIREAVVEYHRRYGYPFSGELSRLMNDATVFVREKAAEYVYYNRDRRFTSEMEQRLEDPSSRVRRFAAMYLRDVGSMNALPLLTRVLADEEDPETQRQLRLALASVKMRHDRRQRALTDARLLEETPKELLEPVGQGPYRDSIGRAIGYALLVAASVLLIFALLSL